MDTRESQRSAIIAAGSTGVNFYNYGLIPAARLDWIRGAIEGARD